MPNVSYRHRTQVAQPHRRSRWSKPLRVISTIFAAGLVVNILLVLLLWNRVPANVRLGDTSVGGMTYAAVKSLPGNSGIETYITLQHAASKIKVQPAQLGLSVDRQASYQRLRNSAIRWLPLVGYIRHTTVPVVLTVSQSQFTDELKTLSGTFERAPQDIHIAFNGSQFVRAAASDGYKIDTSATQKTLVRTVAAGQSTMQVPTQVVRATPHETDLSADITEFNKQLATTVSFATYGGQKVEPTTAERAAWYVPNGQSLIFSKQKVAEYLDNVAANQKIQLLNKADLTTATYYALNHQQKLDFRMVTTSNNKRTYCTAVRGVSEAKLSELNDKLAAVYADIRGWSDQGLIGFEKVDSGCEYTVWLSAADQMTTFASICDDYYNCQSGSNVIVNYDRWAQATPPWNQTGGSIEDYRILIINHETGHRLGFLDNPVCPGAGQPAYVMMQQSIDLNGCAFNVWPTQTELTKLKSML